MRRQYELRPLSVFSAGDFAKLVEWFDQGGYVRLTDSTSATSALEWLADVLQSDPLHTRAFDVYIQELRGAGKWGELAKTLRAHMKALPKNTEAKRLVELFDQLGEAYEHQGQHKTAAAAYDQAARLAVKAGIDVDKVAERRNKVMRLAISLGEDELDPEGLVVLDDVHHARESRDLEGERVGDRRALRQPALQRDPIARAQRQQEEGAFGRGPVASCTCT